MAQATEHARLALEALLNLFENFGIGDEHFFEGPAFAGESQILALKDRAHTAPTQKLQNLVTALDDGPHALCEKWLFHWENRSSTTAPAPLT